MASLISELERNGHIQQRQNELVLRELLRRKKGGESSSSTAAVVAAAQALAAAEEGKCCHTLEKAACCMHDFGITIRCEHCLTVQHMQGQLSPSVCWRILQRRGSGVLRCHHRRSLSCQLASHPSH